GAEIADHRAVPAQIGWMERRGTTVEIFGGSTGDEMHIADAPRNQRLIGQLANADGAIDILRHIIDRPVRYAEIDLDIRITLVKLDQRRNDDQIGDRARHFNAQTPL